MKQIFKKPYIFGLIGVFIFYIVLAVLLTGFYDTFKLILIYANTINWLELGISIFLTLVIGFLVSVNFILTFIKYKQRKKCKQGIVTTGVGAVGGLIVGVCPLCVSGLFPLILGFFGMAFSFASLPFNGIEVQVLVIFILLVSLKMLKK